MSKANVASKSSSTKTISAKKKTPAKVYFKRYWQLYAMLALPMIYFIIFKYIPMQYIQIAWKDYKLNMSVWQMPVTAEHGMKYFNQAFHNMDFWYSVRNTLLLNLLDLILGFPAPIIFALILNELRSRKLKKTVQTVAYMPHFLSWVIISSLALQLFAPSTGLINVVFEKMGIGAVPFLNDSTHWVFTYIFIGIWQSFGWNSIIYLAAITSINPELYEAAAVDGAGRFKKMWHVTLPSIRPTIVVLLIINLGHILGSSFDRPFALRNNTVMDVANVISTFVYTNGIKGLKFSMTTAVGLFQSVIGLIFLLISNRVAKRLGERGIF